MGDRILQLDDYEALDLTKDSRIVALRWDVIPLALVLDLDVCLPHTDPGPMQRAWLCFDGVDTMTWPFKHTRLPTGIWTVGNMWVSSISDKFKEYRFHAIIPEICNDGSLPDKVVEEVVVSAMSLWGLTSSASCASGEDGLEWANRVALASDEELIRAAADFQS